MSGDLPRFHLDLEDNQDGWGKDERSPSRRFVRLRALPCCVLTPVLYEKKKTTRPDCPAKGPGRLALRALPKGQQAGPCGRLYAAAGTAAAWPHLFRPYVTPWCILHPPSALPFLSSPSFRRALVPDGRAERRVHVRACCGGGRHCLPPGRQQGQDTTDRRSSARGIPTFSSSFTVVSLSHSLARLVL